MLFEKFLLRRLSLWLGTLSSIDKRYFTSKFTKNLLEAVMVNLHAMCIVLKMQ